MTLIRILTKNLAALESGVLQGSVVEPCSLEAMGLSYTESSGFFTGDVLGQGTSKHKP